MFSTAQTTTRVSQIRSVESGQTREPVVTRGGGVDQAHPARGAHGPQRHTGPEGDWLSDHLRRPQHAAGQGPAERGQGVRGRAAAAQRAGRRGARVCGAGDAHGRGVSATAADRRGEAAVAHQDHLSGAHAAVRGRQAAGRLLDLL